MPWDPKITRGTLGIRIPPQAFLPSSWPLPELTGTSSNQAEPNDFPKHMIVVIVDNASPTILVRGWLITGISQHWDNWREI